MMFHILLMLFPFLNTVLSYDIFNKITENDIKITANLVSAFHSYSFSLLGTCFFLTNNSDIIPILSTFSISYFIWDTYRILYSKNENNMYIIHHIVAINTNSCIFNKFGNTYLLMFIFTVAELSNVATYPLYHMIRSNKIKGKENFNISIIHFLKKIQLILNFIGRFIVFSYVLIFDVTLSNDIVLYIELIIVYLFGNFWLFQQFKDTYTQNTIKND